MSEMAHAGHDHGKASFIGSGDDFIITHGAAWLNNRRGTRIGRSQQSIRKREERVRGHNGAYSGTHVQALCFT